MDGFEIEYDFPTIGQRTMLLNARKVLYDHNSAVTILLAFNDITARRVIEREKEELLGRTEDLLRQKVCCYVRWSIGLPIACRLLPASCC